MELNVLFIVMNLLGGLAIFLYGMDMMSDALKLMAGNSLKTVLKNLTRNRFAAAGTGAAVTAIIQSSSVTTVLVVGFINAGVMNLEQSIGVIMGANIGSTITAQVIAFKVTQYALGLFFLGWFPLFFIQQEKFRLFCRVMMGLGLIFLGMSLMSEATQPLRNHEPFISAMKDMGSPLYGVFIGALFTAIIQSSSATTGVVIMLASQGILSLPGGIAIVMGANIGTCITAALASIGKNREAIQAVAVHVLFNVIGVILWIFFIPNMAQWVIHFSPTFPLLSGMDRMAAETPRQIANAHTFFNVINTFILIAFTTPMAKFVQWLIPIKKTLEPLWKTNFLNRDFLETPELALDQCKREMNTLISLSMELLKAGKQLSLYPHQDDKKALHLEEGTNHYHRQIIAYLSELSRKNLGSAQSDVVFHLMTLANNIESFGDTISDNIISISQRCRQRNVVISTETVQHLKDLYDLIEDSMKHVLQSLTTEDPLHAQWVIASKAEASHRAEAIAQRLASRLGAHEPNRMETYRLETDLNEMLKRLFYLTKCCAKVTIKLCPAKKNTSTSI